MKLISINVELDKHLDAIIPFLKKEGPDIICVQELLQKDLGFFEKELGMSSVYRPLCVLKEDDRANAWGIAILSKEPLRNVKFYYYRGSPQVLNEYTYRDWDDSGINRLLIVGELGPEEKPFRIATTHFTWAPLGKVGGSQEIDIEKMLGSMEDIPDLVLAGDFNAPRGQKVFDRLAALYKDNVPLGYTTSIDGAFHRAGPLELLVDGLFTTPEYKTQNVHLVSGLSDHMAIVADISRS